MKLSPEMAGVFAFVSLLSIRSRVFGKARLVAANFYTENVGLNRQRAEQSIDSDHGWPPGNC